MMRFNSLVGIIRWVFSFAEATLPRKAHCRMVHTGTLYRARPGWTPAPSLAPPEENSISSDFGLLRGSSVVGTELFVVSQAVESLLIMMVLSLAPISNGRTPAFKSTSCTYCRVAGTVPRSITRSIALCGIRTKRPIRTTSISRLEIFAQIVFGLRFSNSAASGTLKSFVIWISLSHCRFWSGDAASPCN